MEGGTTFLASGGEMQLGNFCGGRRQLMWKSACFNSNWSFASHAARGGAKEGGHKAFLSRVSRILHFVALAVGFQALLAQTSP